MTPTERKAALLRLRDELAPKTGYVYDTNDVVIFKNGFTAAVELLWPEIEIMRKALEFYAGTVWVNEKVYPSHGVARGALKECDDFQKHSQD